MAHKTPTIPRATITVSRATTTVLNHTPSIPGSSPIISSPKARLSPTAPTLPAAISAIVARNAWYTARMPWLRNAHRHTKTRWTLTALAFTMLCGWFVGSWGSVTYTWPSGTTIGIVHGSAEFQVPVRVNPDGPYVVGFLAYWSKPLWQLDLSWGTPALDDKRSACSLFVPGALFGAVAAWLWYRRFRPFARPGRPNRASHFKVLRAFSTCVLCVVLGLAIASLWTGVSFRSQWINAYLFDGTVSVVCSPPLPSAKATGFAMITQSQKDQYEQNRSTWTGFELLVIRARNWQFWHALVSLWFLTLLLAVPAALLWLIRLRRYPVGCCPNCLYDLTGLAAGTPCPECGQKSVSA